MDIRMLFRRLMVNRRLAVICLDGGICSQINLRALGEHLQSVGADVRYSFFWFEGDGGGRDCLGNPTRNFQMDRLFPGLSFPRATHAQIMSLQRANLIWKSAQVLPTECRPPVLVCNDPRALRCLVAHRGRFVDAMRPELSAVMREWTARVEDGACAVHVRLGDLPHAMGRDGGAESFYDGNYFARAAARMRVRYGVSRFVFFSDDPAFVKAHVLPLMPEDVESAVCDVNDQRSGYLDLYLMCHARWLIGSEGSAALFARILSVYGEDGVLILPEGCQHLPAARDAGVSGLEVIDSQGNQPPKEEVCRS